ncbi:MAG TPA: MFS transporter [Candidatus Thermoplasmatota archaeon]|nr:MFS transporter [Candidatus Thermoplasmatota archaeon]
MADAAPARAPAGILPTTVFVLSSGAAVFWAGSAVASDVAAQWSLTGSQAAALSWAVQAGFIVGTLVAAALNLPDRFAPSRLVALLLAIAAIANAALVLVQADLALAVLLRFLAGAFAGPVYPIGMKLLATWFPRLGWELGVLLAFNTLGFGAAFLLRLAALPWEASLLGVSALGLAGALLAWTLREGPLLPARSPFDPRAALRR